MNKTGKRLYILTPKTEAGIRKIPLVKEVRNALEEIKQYQFDNGIFCKAEIDGYADFIFLNRFGSVFIQPDLDRALGRIIDAFICDNVKNVALYIEKIDEMIGRKKELFGDS